MSQVKISIICPTLNEEPYVEALIKIFLDTCPQPSEIFFADAGSTDQTIAIIEKWSAVHPNVKLVRNHRKFVSYAFNACFPLSSGNYVALLGAHTVYPENFFKVAYTSLERGGCDVVGGPLQQVGRSPMGKAIAYCMGTKFGVGGTAFRTSKERMFVDSVAFAFYKREIFERIGLFDERLVRNQDDEMHYRMNAAGYKILMEPAMECSYYVREDLKSLVRQYHQYGLYKPMVLRKVKSGMRPRHLIPPLFVMYLLLAPIATTLVGWVALMPLVLYIAAAGIFAFSNNMPLGNKFRAFVVYPMLHLSYGLGFLQGLFKR